MLNIIVLYPRKACDNMVTTEIIIPENCNISNIGFATALVSKACTFTSEDINIKADDGTYVNLKSILGVLTLNYSKSNKITLQILGELEEQTALLLRAFIEKEIKLNNK